MGPLVSVVIPTHNHSEFLHRSIGSVRNQRFEDYELILVDNGSTDNTKEVIAKLSWDKLRYYYQNDSGSVASPRNTGIYLAHGRYISFLDSDDYWYQNKLERIMEILLKDEDIDIISHDLDYIVKNEIQKTLKVGDGLNDRNSLYERLLFNGNFLLGSATTIRRTTLLECGGFDGRKEFVHAEDFELWLRLAKRNKNFYFLNEALGAYVVHDRNLSSDFETAMTNWRNVITYHFNESWPNPSWPLRWRFLKIKALNYFSLGRKWHYQANFNNAIKNYIKSISLYPLRLERLLYLIIAILHIQCEYLKLIKVIKTNISDKLLTFILHK